VSNHTKALLQRGEVALGISMSIGHLDIVEVLSNYNVDWYWLDTEHAPQSSETLHASMHLLRSGRPTPIIRVAWNDMVLIKKALDIGAAGILVPWVNTREQAEAAVCAAKYPPEGLRGIGPRWVKLAGVDAGEYMKTANDDVLVVVQIETTEAVENLEAILTTPGVDAFLIGPSDLSASLGHVGDPDHPEVEATFVKIIETGQRLGVPGGFATPSIESAQKRIDQGFQLVTIGSDIGFVSGGCEAALRGMGRDLKA
jgi:4-hydroxy-2-oxoheptanedioate aldolase